MDIEDKILLLRGILGLIAGVFSVFAGSFIYALIAVIIAYIVSIPVVTFYFKIKKNWLVFGKGGLTLAIAWFLILVTVYNVFG
ncbi:hypothetical protein [Acidianus sp. HS-5]|uniref:hypothetical protein n=1 Tax=Acidianus sp. HS-5 TaxID=2886040 RepID=UPI001F368D79|nr:hypothetical protein [Acidianus sp. HS-5]BDC19103.1 hypothetical protein HS5_19930 [Acidianus sp. HS-5]